MQITIRLMGIDMTPQPKSIVLKLDRTRVTVEEALLEFANSADLSQSAKELMDFVMLAGNKRVYADSLLSDGDTLTILRTLEGG